MSIIIIRCKEISRSLVENKIRNYKMLVNLAKDFIFIYYSFKMSRRNKNKNVSVSTLLRSEKEHTIQSVFISRVMSAYTVKNIYILAEYFAINLELFDTYHCSRSKARGLTHRKQTVCTVV